ncbi:TIGR04197 family type VII secretion effector [Xylocopilactobacillus apicola]|uniref:TIGR04197 family type VII secretion effector n=1 Tax=Xylocopilactobacillus apicola TaxID=2932184 RepID=A0AAU9DYK4_9LACO|nr:TIGR04197 family type VII secretion effector [Xylocopilactobacillus apicola]BDR59268.1 hypothetical protein XA3_17090 [Xylocopilactobacillus apicola]
MNQILTDFNVASNKATRIKTATDNLNSSSSVNQDKSTKMLGNASAHKAIAATKHSAQKISQVVNSASQHLRSVAKDFEAADQEISQKLFEAAGWRR